MKPGIIIQEVSLHSSAPTLDALPDEGIPEVAIVGRSNVGKSTLLNRLTGRKKLAYTSSVPGKTQAFFSYQVKSKKNGEQQIMHLVDLPGFGYAKFSKRKREYISRLTVEYILNRPALHGVLLLNDIRRDPQEDELTIQQIGYEGESPVSIILTKSDKVKKHEIQKRQKAIAAQYHLEPEDLLVTGEKYPIEPLWEQIYALTQNNS